MTASFASMAWSGPTALPTPPATRPRSPWCVTAHVRRWERAGWRRECGGLGMAMSAPSLFSRLAPHYSPHPAGTGPVCPGRAHQTVRGAAQHQLVPGHGRVRHFVPHSAQRRAPGRGLRCRGLGSPSCACGGASGAQEGNSCGEKWGVQLPRPPLCRTRPKSAPLCPTSAPQESNTVALPITAAEVQTAAQKALQGKTVGREPEVRLELRAVTASKTPWCEKVRRTCGG